MKHSFNYFLQGFFSMVIVTLFGCVEHPDVGLYFCPRQVDYLWATNCYKTTFVENGHILHDYYVLSEDSIKAEDFFISLSTGNKDMLSVFGDYRFVFFFPDYHYTGTPIPSLEAEIRTSYTNEINKESKSSSVGTAVNMTGIEYRTNGVKSLTISALDTELFEKNPLESINDFFEIFMYSPDFIASAETKNLLYGYSDANKPTSIDEWLSLKPMAQPSILLRFKAIPPGLPITTRFKIDMVTDDGLQLSDTTKSVTITN